MGVIYYAVCFIPVANCTANHYFLQLADLHNVITKKLSF